MTAVTLHADLDQFPGHGVVIDMKHAHRLSLIGVEPIFLPRCLGSPFRQAAHLGGLPRWTFGRRRSLRKPETAK